MPAKQHSIAFVRLISKHGEWLVHPDLRPQLVAKAHADGVSLTTAATAILAERYKVPFTPVERFTEPSPEGEELHLRLPTELYRRIERATPRPQSVPDAIRATLCAHFRLRVPPKPKSGRRRRAAPEAA